MTLQRSRNPNLTAQMVREGTGKRGSLKIADDLEYIGASLNIYSTTDATLASMLTLKEHLPTALEIYSDVLCTPSFPDSEWVRVKKTHLTGLMQRKDRPVAVADNVFAQLLYGSNEPYGRPTEGTEASVKLVSLEDLKTFYKTNYVPNNATLIVVGDVTVADVLRCCRNISGIGSLACLLRIFSVPNIDSTRIYLIDKPQAAQSEIRIGHVGVARSNPDYFL